VGIAAGAPHRGQALAAVAQAIERVKQAVPVWKREFYSNGSAWIEAPAPAPPEEREPDQPGPKKRGKLELPRSPA